MTRPNIHALIVLVSCAGLVGLFTEHRWRPWLSAALADPMPVIEVVPFSTAMECPPWRPGLSRTVVVMATEDARGKLVEHQCIRTEERKTGRRM